MEKELTLNQSSIRDLKKEIKQLKETYEIITDKEILNSIKKSLKEISKGKGIRLEDFLKEFNL